MYRADSLSLLVYFFSRYLRLCNFQKRVTHYDTFAALPNKVISGLCEA